MRVAPPHETLALAARAHWRRGEIEAASAQAEQSLALYPGFIPALVIAGMCGHALGNAADCRHRFAQLALSGTEPAVVEFVFQVIVEIVRDGRRVFAPATLPPIDVAPLSITVVTCSIDETKLARCTESLRRCLGPGFEHLVFRAPPSLARAYNEALAVARGDAIVFIHDDVELLTPGLNATLARVLSRADVAGVAGTRRLAGPTLGWAGQEAMSGWLVHGSSAAATWDFSLLALRGGLVGQMQALDGCFLAARTSSARQIAFDAEHFDGFHFYDLDFCLRAHRAGLELAVTTDVLLAHASRGRLGFAWEYQARRFQAKFAPLGQSPAQPSHFHAARLASADEALRLHAELNGFCAEVGLRAA